MGDLFLLIGDDLLSQLTGFSVLACHSARNICKPIDIQGAETVKIQYGPSVVEFPQALEDSVSDLLSGQAIRIGDLKGTASLEDRIEIARRTTEIGLTQFHAGTSFGTKAQLTRQPSDDKVLVAGTSMV